MILFKIKDICDQSVHWHHSNVCNVMLLCITHEAFDLQLAGGWEIFIRSGPVISYPFGKEEARVKIGTITQHVQVVVIWMDR